MSDQDVSVQVRVLQRLMTVGMITESQKEVNMDTNTYVYSQNLHN